MLFLLVIYHSAVFVDRIVSFIAPRTLLAEWFFWFIDDAKTLLLVGRELECARAYRECANTDELVEFTVYHAGVFFGERDFYCFRDRWPHWYLHYFEQIGMQLDDLQWKTGCVDGFLDKAALEHA
ncbi:hypothetical protein [Citrobacter farmeri]